MKSVLVLSSVVLFTATPIPVWAQTGAIVQATPPALAVERLNQNLTRLSRAPTDIDALIGAGNASYELGDAQAANGFFTRANMVNPRIGRVKVGLALVSLALKQPREAADYFDQAAQLGEPASGYLGERALAYDLVGQQDKAQRDYVAALRANPSDKELVRRYAISLGISGKLPESEVIIRPLLYQSDRAAWRDRTMILAMNGKYSEAHRIAQTVMPRPLADSVDPYLKRMSGLSPAQKAAAAHYGQFPADGLRMSPSANPPPVQVASNDSSGRRKKKDKNAPAAASGDDSMLIAAMPHADALSATVQTLPGDAPASPSRPMVMASRDGSGDDDPDGWSGSDSKARTVSRPVQPPATVQTDQSSRATAASSYANSQSGRLASANAPAAGVWSVNRTPATPRPTAPDRSLKNATSAPSMFGPASASTAVSASVPAPAPVAIAPPTPAPVPAPAQAPVVASAPVQAQGPPSSLGPAVAIAAVPAETPPTVAARAAAPVALAAPATSASAVPQPGFSADPVAGPATPSSARSLAAIMADIQVPDAERQSTTTAVDLAEIARIQDAKRAAIAKVAADKAKAAGAAKAKAEALAAAKAEAEEKALIKANPARIWVQVATGRDVDALAFDMRRLRKTYAPIADQGGSTAEWGATRRLLVGPFPSAARAKAVDLDLRKAGADSFVWQSAAGEVVTALSRQ